MARIVSVIALVRILGVAQNATQVALAAVRANTLSPPRYLGVNGGCAFFPRAGLHDGVNELVKKVVRGHLMRTNIQVATGQIFFNVPINVVVYAF